VLCDFVDGNWVWSKEDSAAMRFTSQEEAYAACRELRRTYKRREVWLVEVEERDEPEPSPELAAAFEYRALAMRTLRSPWLRDGSRNEHYAGEVTLSTSYFAGLLDKMADDIAAGVVTLDPHNMPTRVAVMSQGRQLDDAIRSKGPREVRQIGKFRV
jgi:hypothetical protein